MAEKSGQTELFTRARSGDVDALNQLTALARLRLINHAKRTTLDDALSEDAVQETLLAIQTQFEELNDIEHFWGWLHKTLNFKLRHAIDRRLRDRNVESLSEETGEIQDPNYPSGLEAAIITELKNAVLDSMNRLSPQQRTILRLRYYDSLPFHDIAQKIGIGIITARVQLWRAKKALERNLDRNGFGEGLLRVALGQSGESPSSTEAARPS